MCLSFMLALSTVSVQAEWESEPTDWHFNQNPVKVLEKVKKNANRKKSEEVQKTQLDNTTSKWCKDVWIYSSFTITKTLCYVKNNSWSYLQYVMYFALTAATIFLIWNWFNIVISSDKEKQMTTFKKNLIYIIVWIVLITCFYYFIDIYVWIINLFTE